MTRYRIGSILVDPNQPDVTEIFAQAYEEFKAKGKLRPMCLCNGEPGLPMYIVKVNDNYYLKRMPNTGRQHAVGCGSWEMPDAFSGRTDVFGSGISYEGDNMMLRLSFPLAKQGSRVAPEPNANSSEDKLSVNNGGKKLSLQGLLHMLWEEAGLNKWQGAEPNRTWEYVFQSLHMAVEGKVVKQHPLGRFLYVPQPFHKEKIEELEGDRKKRFIEHAMQEGKQGHQLMLLIGELKKIEESGSGGYRAIVKHVPGFPFIVNDHLNDRITKHYSKEISTVKATEEKWSHQIIAATFSVMPEGSAEIDEISYMPVTAQWIPFDNIYENELLAKLVATKRSFTRPLRYNRLKGVTMPSAVLTDTGRGPTALYVVAPNQDIEKVQRESLELDYDKWFWNLMDAVMLPALPARSDATEEAGETQRKVGESAKPPMTPAPIPTATHPFLKDGKSPAAQGTRYAEPQAPQPTSPAPVTSTGTRDVAKILTPADQQEPGFITENSAVAIVELQEKEPPPNATEAMPMLFQ